MMKEAGKTDIESQPSAALLRRAYGLESADEARVLYRDWASSYDTHLEQGLGYRAPAQIAAMLVEVLDDHTAMILDVGCGTGLVGACLAAHGFNTIDGLDFSPEMLAVASQKSAYRNLLEADLEKPLKLTDASYDAAISCGTFTHGHVGAQALDRIFQLLRPGGVLACTIHRDLWVDQGFCHRIEALEEGGVISTEKMTDQPYFDGADADGKFCLFRKV